MTDSSTNSPIPEGTKRVILPLPDEHTLDTLTSLQQQALIALFRAVSGIPEEVEVILVDETHELVKNGTVVRVAEDEEHECAMCGKAVVIKAGDWSLPTLDKTLCQRCGAVGAGEVS